jgi:hypothetical protein
VRGAIEISGKSSTFKLGVNGSGSRMLRGKADKIKFLNWKKVYGNDLLFRRFWSLQQPKIGNEKSSSGQINQTGQSELKGLGHKKFSFAIWKLQRLV